MKKPIINPQIIKRLKTFFAIVQDSDTATRNIAVGKYVIWKNIPCRASTTIVSGDTLAIGTNLTAVDDGFINTLNDDISWKALTPTTGTAHMTIPDNTQAREFLFVARYGNPTSGLQALSFTYYVPNIPTLNNLSLTQGYNDAVVQIALNLSSHVAFLASLKIGATDYASSSVLYGYYR